MRYCLTCERFQYEKHFKEMEKYGYPHASGRAPDSTEKIIIKNQLEMIDYLENLIEAKDSEISTLKSEVAEAQELTEKALRKIDTLEAAIDRRDTKIESLQEKIEQLESRVRESSRVNDSSRRWHKDSYGNWIR